MNGNNREIWVTRNREEKIPQGMWIGMGREEEWKL